MKNNKIVQLDENWKTTEGKYKCPLCYEDFSKYGISTHIKVSHFGIPGKGGHNMKNKSPWNKGLTKETDKRVRKSGEAISKTFKKCPEKMGGFVSKEFQDYMKTDEYKKEQSERMLQVVKDNPDSYSANNVCGRSKKVIYNEETYQSTWEVIVAKYFDMFQMPYERKVKPIEYFWNGKIRSYFPDFYIRQWDIYIEVKGYETERDHAKWSALDNLIVLKEKEIKMLEKAMYRLDQPK